MKMCIRDRDLDVFIEKLCELFPPETGRAAIMEIK